jgi:hypothetical protein
MELQLERLSVRSDITPASNRCGSPPAQPINTAPPSIIGTSQMRDFSTFQSPAAITAARTETFFRRAWPRPWPACWTDFHSRRSGKRRNLYFSSYTGTWTRGNCGSGIRYILKYSHRAKRLVPANARICYDPVPNYPIDDGFQVHVLQSSRKPAAHKRQ